MSKLLHYFYQEFGEYHLNFTLVIIIISVLGIETSSFIAYLLLPVCCRYGITYSGTLQNFAGGVMILLSNRLKWEIISKHKVGNSERDPDFQYHHYDYR